MLDVTRADGPVSTIAGPLPLFAEPDDMINAAVDVLTARHQVSRDEASDLLEQATDDHRRPLVEVAEDVVLIELQSVGAQIDLRPTPPPPAVTIAAGLLERLVRIAPLSDVLNIICELAADVVPGCEEANITVLREGAAATLASAHSGARHVDEAQYRHGQGPGLQAVHTGGLIRIDDIRSVATDQAWARAALDAGFTAVVSVAIETEADTAATLSLYSSEPDGWSPESVAAARTLAEYAGHAVAAARRGETGS